MRPFNQFRLLPAMTAILTFGVVMAFPAWPADPTPDPAEFPVTAPSQPCSSQSG